MEITTSQKIENSIKWLTALKSGDYKQKKYTLGSVEKGFCCWGLGCYLVNIEFDKNERWNPFLYQYLGFNEENGDIQPIVIINKKISPTLAHLNDDLGWSFTQIADYLIENASTNFEPKVAEAIKLHFTK